ncbi:NUDIX hydrolase [Vagococcus carniphilus]|uniref:NUDIX hydrolase n=1 Tax=Vagococcus carniphilus TaxID=218144 RepID=UPI003B5AC21A
MKAELIKQLQDYIPFNEQEEKDKEVIIEALINHEDIFYRSNLMAHITVSAWVTNANRDKVLMAYHNIYDSWSWLGGHADGDEDLLQVALKEVKEESGLEHVTPVSSDIYSLEVLTVDGHMKHQAYVPSHLHLNLTYLIEATEEETLQVKVDENSQLGWFSLERAVQASSEPWFRDRIYSKLNQKLLKF